jgi:hypothetical protein
VVVAVNSEVEDVDAGLFTSLDGVWQSYGYDEKKKRELNEPEKTEEVDAGLFTSLDGVWQSYGYDE